MDTFAPPRCWTTKGVLFVALWAVSWLPAVGSSAESMGDHDFGVNGKAVLCVPQVDLDPVLIPYNDESTDLAVGSGRTPGFGFLVYAEDVRKHSGLTTFRTFPQFDEHPYVNKLSGSVGFISMPDSRRLGPAMRARDLDEEWNGNGACGREVVTRLGQGDLFEVKCRAKDNYANILSRAPDHGQAMPDANSLVVATCVYETISEGKFAGLSRQSCTRAVLLDGFFVNYRLQEENLPLYRQLDELLREKIAMWKARCISR